MDNGINESGVETCKLYFAQHKIWHSFFVHLKNCVGRVGGTSTFDSIDVGSNSGPTPIDFSFKNVCAANVCMLQRRR